MTKPEVSVSPAYSLALFQLEPVNRLGTFAALASASIFAAWLGISMTEQAWLTCARDEQAARCSMRSVYALGIPSLEPPALVTRAHTELRIEHDKYHRPHRVLLLEVTGGPPRELPEVGKAGARAQEVAREVSGFLAADVARERRVP